VACPGGLTGSVVVSGRCAQLYSAAVATKPVMLMPKALHSSVGVDLASQGRCSSEPFHLRAFRPWTTATPCGRHAEEDDTGGPGDEQTPASASPARDSQSVPDGRLSRWLRRSKYDKGA